MACNRGAIAILVQDPRSNLRRLIATGTGMIAAAMLVLMLVPAQRAQALSLASPGAAALSAKFVSDGLIEVRGGGGGHGGGGHGGGGHGGGGHGGGFHGGGGGFHGGGFHGFHGGFVGRPHGFIGHRGHFRGRHFFGPRFYGGYYPYYYGPRCRVIWTYYGPRRVCRWHHWHHRHWRRHHRHWW
jgi:hypothetical protein